MKNPLFIGILFILGLSITVSGIYFAATAAGSDKISSNEIYSEVAKNIDYAQSLMECADGYLQSYADNLQQARELLVRGANGIYTPRDRKQMIDEIASKMDECVRIVECAQFNGQTVFYDPSTGENSRVFPVTLSPNEPACKLVLSCEGFSVYSANFLLAGLSPNPDSMSVNLGVLDCMLVKVFLERARISAYRERLGFALESAEIFAAVDSRRNRLAKLDDIADRIEKRLYALAVQSANGIYTQEDRYQLQVAYDELGAELVRIENVSGVSSPVSGNDRVSIMTQPEAESVMLAFANRIR